MAVNAENAVKAEKGKKTEVGRIHSPDSKRVCYIHVPVQADISHRLKRLLESDLKPIEKPVRKIASSTRNRVCDNADRDVKAILKAHSSLRLKGVSTV